MISRREFVAGLAATVALNAASAADGAEAVELIDTHTHFYDPERPGGVPWPAPADKALYRRVLPAEYIAMAKPHGVAGTVVVEASPRVADNDWLLGLAEQERFILGVVGNLDPLSPEFSANLRRLAANPRFVGIRVSGKQLMERGAEPGYIRAMAQLAETGRSLDLNGPREYLRAVEPLSRAVPELRIILDHAGSAGDAGNLSQNWRDGMAAAASRGNVFCKVSGLPEQAKAPAGKAPVDADYYRPILDALAGWFGPERLIWGSNWPVSDKGAAFKDVVKISRGYFDGMSAAVQRAVFSGNARKFYRV